MPDIMAPQRVATIESRASWVAAAVTLAILSISYGAPLLVVVGLRPIQESLGTTRSVVALAGALYDRFGFYAPAFGVGVVFNIANLAVIGFLVARQRGSQLLAVAYR